MKVLITGSSGMLAKEIIRSFSRDDTYNLYGVDIVESANSYKDYRENILDLTHIDDLERLLGEIDPDLIIHCAAIVNLNVCETDPDFANRLHIEVSRTLANHGSKIFYISTDSVFNGIKGNYSETDIPDPINNYARSKYLGELAIRANNSNHGILRTNIFGFTFPLKGSLAEWGLKSFQNQETINGFTDVMFNAIYTGHLSESILELVRIDYSGLLNVASGTIVSKYEFLQYLAEQSKIPGAIVKESLMSEIKFKIPFKCTDQ